MLTQKKLQISEEVLYEKIGEEMVLLNLETGTYFGLNPVGSRMWELLAVTGEPETIVQTLCEEFDVAVDILERDLADLVRELNDKKLIEFL